MKKKETQSKIEVVQGDITAQETDAVVNAANKALAPGGGVAGSIHRAAGPDLWEECRRLGGCQTGEAKLSKGYNLKAKYVIHTVGPVYSGSPKDPRLLADCYRNSLRLAAKKGIKTISFPALSTGVFGYPLEEAARVALSAVTEGLKKYPKIKLVRFVLYDEGSFNIHQKILAEMSTSHKPARHKMSG